jgi:hypothetical protein
MIPTSISLCRFAAAASICLTTLAMVAPARAADMTPPREPLPTLIAQKDWSITVTPYLWAASLNGSAGVLGIQRDVDVPFRDTLKHLDFGFMGNVEYRQGYAGAYVNAEYTKVSNNAHLGPFNIGVSMRSALVSTGFFYRVYEAALGGNTIFGTPRVFAIEPTVGMRWTSMTARAHLGFFSVSEQQSWVDPFIGARFNYDLNDRWNLFVESDLGGFGAGSRFSVNAQAVLGYRMLLAGYKTTLGVGYRVLKQDYRDGGFQWNVTQHGPLVGASIQF